MSPSTILQGEGYYIAADLSAAPPCMKIQHSMKMAKMDITAMETY